MNQHVTHSYELEPKMNRAGSKVIHGLDPLNRKLATVTILFFQIQRTGIEVFFSFSFLFFTFFFSCLEKLKGEKVKRKKEKENDGSMSNI